VAFALFDHWHDSVHRSTAEPTACGMWLESVPRVRTRRIGVGQKGAPMFSHRSAAACAASTRLRLGLGESAVIIVITVMAMLATTHGTPLREVMAMLGSSELLGVLMIRCSQMGPLTVVIRRVGRFLLFPAQV